MDINKRKLIGMRINSALASANMKQKELAASIGVTDNTISYFVSGSRVPNTEQIIKIATALNISCDYLLGLTDVATTDKDIQLVCDCIGLSEEAVQTLRNWTLFIDGKSDLIDTDDGLFEYEDTPEIIDNFSAALGFLDDLLTLHDEALITVGYYRVLSRLGMDLQETIMRKQMTNPSVKECRVQLDSLDFLIDSYEKSRLYYFESVECMSSAIREHTYFGDLELKKAANNKEVERLRSMLYEKIKEVKSGDMNGND